MVYNIQNYWVTNPHSNLDTACAVEYDVSSFHRLWAWNSGEDQVRVREV
jgi:hypothetical protein